MKKLHLPLLAFSSLFMLSCGSDSESTLAPHSAQEEVSTEAVDEGRVEKILTKEEQDQLTPDKVLSLLKQGNARFVDGLVTHRNHTEQIRKAVKGQFPKAVVLSCIDSRVPVEDVFDRGIGDVFVARVAGNFVNVDILGSMEYACKVAGSKLVLVMGHEHCGAVKGTIQDVKLGNITEMLSKIKPAVDSMGTYEGDKSTDNKEYVHLVSEMNVRLNVARVRNESPVLKEMEDNGEIRIIGALYDMDTGQVYFVD